MSEVIVITGAAGLLGFHLAQHYLQKDDVVIGVDNLITGTSKNIHDLQLYPTFQFIRHSVEDDWYAVEQFLKVQNLSEVKYVFHFASIAEPNKFQSHFQEIMRANSIGTMNALDFSKKYKARLIYASSSEIYGNIPTGVVSEKEFGHVNSVGVRSCYNESKRFSESLISHMNRVYKTQHGVVRIFNTYGPRMNPLDTRVIMAMINWALWNKNIQIYGNDSRTRSFCYVDDLVQGVVDYAASNIVDPMNLGNDTEISIVDLADKIIKLCRSKSQIAFQPARIDEVAKRKPSLEFAKQTIGFKAGISLDQGLMKTIEFLKKNAQPRFQTASQQGKINHGQNTEQIS